MLKYSDAVVLTETKGTWARSNAFFPLLQSGITARWSHALDSTEGEGIGSGVGVLVRDSFLAHFHTTTWEDIVPGHIAVLRCRGPSGGLDLWAIYGKSGASAGCDAARKAGWSSLASSHSSRQEALTVLLGISILWNTMRTECTSLRVSSRGKRTPLRR